MSHSDDATYLEERILFPLQRAIALVKKVGQVEITLSQKQDQLTQLDAQIKAAQIKQNELTATVERMKATNNEQRMELQALLQEERRIREQERTDHFRVQEQRKQEVRDETARMNKIKHDREQAEKQLDALKAELSKRFQAVQDLVK